FGFFFSSRRRHTSFSRDWSSDVCSSDLWQHSRCVAPAPERPPRYLLSRRDAPRLARALNPRTLDSGTGPLESSGPVSVFVPSTRSEERRVGRERKSWWTPDE